MLPILRAGRLFPQHRERGAHEVKDRCLKLAHFLPVARDAEPLPNRCDRAQQQRWGHGHHCGVEVKQRIGAVQHVIRA